MENTYNLNAVIVKQYCRTASIFSEKTLIGIDMQRIKA